MNTYRESQKARNISNSNTTYFSVDGDTFPYRCVKGKARVTISEQVDSNLATAGRIMTKYPGSTDHPTAVEVLNSITSGDSIVMQLEPACYSTWRFG